ncbi:uncharacterized protein LOC105207291 isoform X2 [Solenopsis invicta]|nr:uncharacterized protein LOC105207291 isoform X2 [Solenopsis invicta]XP_039310143.1 uncharacterized protein LOC105207291 isoform X2 [Solenopsis invicta]XP_039310144.1 uncharacterized protein LOC105207291 isoform X2 [Solenopsis invicta]
MSDHSQYCQIYNDSLETSTDDKQDNCDPVFINVEEKQGDELLIELYRERVFLYDKSNANYKNFLMKENAWIEISKIMTETNCGDMYTPSYCQKRCVSLRDQYNREKRKLEIQSKSGSGASKASQFPFFSQLAFLDRVIKRRRSYTNCTISEPVINEDDDLLQSVASSSNSENKNVNKQHIDNKKYFNKENVAPKHKKWKVDETKELEQSLVQMTQRISSYMENKSSTAHNAFMDFIKVQFSTIPEKEKNARRKMIMDALTMPLSEQ